MREQSAVIDTPVHRAESATAYLRMPARQAHFYRIAVVVAVFACQIAIAEDELPQNARLALERNADALSAVTAVWSMKRESRLPLNKLLSEIGFSPLDQDFLDPITAKYQAKAGRYKVRFNYMVMLLTDDHKRVMRKVPAIQEFAYNGERFYQGAPRSDASNGILNISTLEKRLREASPADIILRTNYFRDAGFKIAEFFGDNLTEPKSLILYMIDNGGSLREVIQSQFGDPLMQVAIIYGGLVHVYKLDPSHGYAVKEYRRLIQSGKPVAHAIMSEMQPLRWNREVWVPHRIVTTYFKWPYAESEPRDEALFTEVMALANIDKADPAVDEFKLEYREPGTLVIDATLPESDGQKGGVVSYYMPADPSDLDAVIKNAIDGTPFTPSVLQKSWRTTMLLAANLSVIIAIAFLIWRSRRQA